MATCLMWGLVLNWLSKTGALLLTNIEVIEEEFLENRDEVASEGSLSAFSPEFRRLR